MIIKKLVLENIRSYKKANIEFEQGITVITGRTGSGKSTILMAISYALFGNETGMNYASLLRRGCEKGSIKLVFEHENKDYNITRGIIKKKVGISFDKNELLLSVNNKIIPVISRVKDFDEKIRQILGYDSNLFNVISYTQQDEIRKLIELKNEARQEFIDEILELSKYKIVWNNLKEVIILFNNKIIDFEAKIGFKQEIEKELFALKKEYEFKNQKIKLLKKEIELEKNVFQISEKKYLQTLKEKKGIEELFTQNITTQKRKELLENQLVKLLKRISELTKTIPESKENFENLNKKIQIILEKKYSAKTLLTLNKNDSKELLDVNEGICPTCKQKVDKQHLIKRGNELEKEKKKKEKEIVELETIEKELTSNIRIENVKKRILEQISLFEKEKERVSSEIIQVQKINVQDYSESLKTVRVKFEKIFEEYANIKTIYETKKIELDYLEENIEKEFGRIKTKQEKIFIITVFEEKLLKTRKQLSLIIRLREDIRNIREVVRDNFLEQFREEFQKLFEEIRKFEDEYTVDVLNNYEPIAYSISGDETLINSLSGGEKTGVALAYRIALSNIAAEIANISQSEVLILDEPTTGFDSEDIKILPETLEKIRIKQIIIVTHENELRNAAHMHYEVEKKNGKSLIN
ncbi:MAG: AAA family ATPase [Nanoarchaeota archaeon]|nr:AAA family ATPase [Nanoarchaeota archaeon]